MFFIQISIFMVSCILLISPFPVNGKEFLKYGKECLNTFAFTGTSMTSFKNGIAIDVYISIGKICRWI